MELYQKLKLNPKETLLLVVDLQKDFLEALPGFAFFDAGDNQTNMQAMVKNHLYPFIEYSLERQVHLAYTKSEYPKGKFDKPYDNLCSQLPGTDFYLIGDLMKGYDVKVYGKSEYDPFSNQGLKKYITKKKIRNLILTGVTLTHCIDAAVNSALLIPNLDIIVPKNCVSYRTKRECDANSILDYYSLPEKERIKVVVSSQITYNH